MFQERGKQGDVGGKDRLTKEAHRMGMRRTVLLLASVVSAMLLVCGMVLVAPEKPARAAFPGTNGKIAFETNRDGNWEIYSMNADGTEQKNLTNNPPKADLGGASGIDRNPTWSPDGKQIAFLSYRDGDYEIYSMNADGTEQKNLTNRTTWDMSPAWSPDGKQIAFRSDLGSSNWDVWVMNTDGTGKTRLTYGAYAMEMSWSPNGKQIAFASYQGDGNLEIYLMNADGTGLTRLTDDSAEDRHPDWSPDGTKIAFESNRGGGYRVWVMNADGTGQTPLSKEPPSGGTSFFNPAWAPDGTKIVFAGSYGISVMASDGTVVQERLTDSTAENYAPTWQPLPDTIAPKVTRVNPAENANGIAPGANVKAIFSEAMRVDSINVNTIELFKKGSTTKVAAAVSYDAATDKATLDPTNSLKRGATYKAVVTTVAEDLAGNHLDQNTTTTGLQQKAWTFKIRN